MPLDSEKFTKWKKELTELADACPNVYCKIGGAQFGSGFGFGKKQGRPAPIGSHELAEAMLPWVTVAIEAFGPTRCLFESNFPVDKMEMSYRTCWNAFKRVASRLGLTTHEKGAIFHDTAVKVYGMIQALCQLPVIHSFCPTSWQSHNPPQDQLRDQRGQHRQSWVVSKQLISTAL
jgi:predicted TIM-barrel fold metal-dependent hydrolase